ncbi:tetratricopeptide repeat protein [Hymenobacter properus]|uniref:Tetratricopeptide repeat protein n=1 Tax=Hymenobacter properus TaxID=2791026 RepID=A0A931BHX6_9BACT|nr:tetratricopeptide repeat protein [Hymenobacter properus]MBF9144245.1 tetratricopeptide repeat protein [Hymenobacter properus]MBR7723063.1 tetratricopeptide repeat protein [Microvirga sp. SRT04]
MKKALLVLLLAGSMGAAYAQTSGGTPSRDLVAEGVKLYDQGKYAEAVAKYQQVLASAPNDELALSELALAYSALGRDAETVEICQKLLKAKPDSDVMVYVTLGNSLDALKKPKEAIRVYEQGLKHHPDSYALYFNEGVAQATSGQVAASVGSFQQSVALSPGHTSSHMSLGVMQLSNQARVPGILAMSRFLVLEPRGARATQRLPMLDKAMSQGVSQTGEKDVTINISSAALSGSNGKSKGPDNFGPVELMLSLSAANALTKDSKSTSNIERFAKQFGDLCQTLGELSNNQQGFTWNYYVPYFVEMEKKGFVPAFAYLSHASQTDVPEVQQWLTAHPTEVQVFQEWSKNYAWPKAIH